MKYLIALALLFSSYTFSQSVDYNTKKGFVAEGYDVVAYFDNKAVEGDKKITTIYDGVKYKFSTKKNLAIFNENPEKYIPQYGGYCAYAVALKSDKVSIDPETFEIRDGKLYLFYNAWGTNTLEFWQNETTTELINKANKNWEKIKQKK